MAVKEYAEVLVLAKGIASSVIREAGDGIQIKDLIPVVSENAKAAMAAYQGGSLIASEWKEDLEGCIALTVDYVVDIACDVLKVPAGEPSAFKETKELLSAVEGITSSIIQQIPGGFQAAEILPIVFDNFNEIIIGLEGVDKVRGEFGGNIRDFIKLVSTTSIQLAFRIKAALEVK